jgi:hypothetical protein
MVRMFRAPEWTRLVWQSTDGRDRDKLLGVSVTLAAKLLGVTRSRVHQLVKTRKVSIVDVYDAGIRIGHLVTLASIEHRRRTVRPRRTQWRAWSRG